MTRLKLHRGPENRLLRQNPETLSELFVVVREIFELPGHFDIKYEDEEKDRITIRTEAEYQAHLASLPESQVCKLYLSEIEEDQTANRLAPTDGSVSLEEAKREAVPTRPKEHEKLLSHEQSVLERPDLDLRSEIIEKNEGEPTSLDVFISRTLVENVESEEDSEGSASYEYEEDDIPEAGLEESKLINVKEAASVYIIKNSGFPVLGDPKEPAPPQLSKATPECTDQATITQPAETSETSSNTELTETKEQAVNSEEVKFTETGSEAYSVETAEASASTPHLEHTEQAVETYASDFFHKEIGCTTEMVDSASDAIKAAFADAATAMEVVELTEATTSIEPPSTSEIAVEAIRPSHDIATDPLAVDTKDSSSATHEAYQTFDNGMDRRSLTTHEVSVERLIETSEICLGTTVETRETSSCTFHSEPVDQNCGESTEFMEAGCDAQETSATSTETQLIESCTVATEPLPSQSCDFSTSVVPDCSHAATVTDYPSLIEAGTSTSRQPSEAEFSDKIFGDLRSAIRVEFSSLRSSQRESLSEVHRAGCMKCAVNPIKGPRYVCVSCDDVVLCGLCEELFRHPHALLKLRRQSQLRWFQELKISTSSLSAPDVVSQSIINLSQSAMTSDKVDRVTKMGFTDIPKIMMYLVQNDYDVDRTVDALLNS
jgi:hypothetical protein